ncbi:hypothetical protein SAMN02927930_00174 [Pseudidiomarina indica]|uniref:TraB family protein n=1 Tax=Pseudidiomarina indica TaxID=1159017 RepID=A0A1G6A731_9GAMM|nr:TraB/GumN family protein [Pseudidiomarina indica]SDB04271.1 hypothetical protein SAMN02927930_00174 [Pseudidiomarina indica]
MRYLVSLLMFFIPFSSVGHVFFKLEHAEYPTSYLFGTMHMLCGPEVEIPANVQQAFIDSQQLVVEIDLTDIQQIREIQANIRQQPTNYLDEHLTEEQQTQLSERVEQVLQAPYPAMKEIRPFLLNALFMQHYMDCPDSMLLMDEAFITRAKMAQKTVVGLETALQQLQVFDSLPLAEQVTSLLEVALNPEQTKVELKALEELYLSDNSEALHRHILAESEGTPQFEEAVLIERNHRWVEQLQEILPQHSSFIAVGAGHLGGQDGLIQLLQQQGYQLTPIAVDFKAQTEH